MLKRTEIYGRVFIAAIVVTLTAPVLSIGSDLGHDWYCPDPAAHAQYTKHLKLHLDHGAENIANVLDKIYSDPSLTAEQKHTKSLTILNKELSKVQVGPGVGD